MGAHFGFEAKYWRLFNSVLGAPSSCLLQGFASQAFF